MAVAAKKYSQLRRTEFFESSTLPETAAIVKELTRMRKDFAESTVLVSEHRTDDAHTLRRKGFRITPL
jgi:hypothetical protein